MDEFYVTKYALTTGILKVQGEVVQGKYVSAKRRTGSLFVLLGDHAFTTLEAAEAKAKEMAIAKKASIIKQLRKLEGYTPKVVDWNSDG
jgi:hypothetical protein